MSERLLAESSASREAFFEQEKERLAQLGREGQSPDVMFIGCSDSRVLAESLTGARPGDLFVVRVIANIVPPPGSGESVLAAAIDYALDVLKVKRIIVCGHTDCGGLRALERGLENGCPGNTADWMTHALPAFDSVQHKGLCGEELHDALVEENVLLQLEHVRAYPSVQRAEAEGIAKVHGWIFDLEHRHMRYYDRNRGSFVVYVPSTT
ncbi:MAG: carbonic anhydrase [Candidatus Hydrogenedentes bacterium]|nr:carbonic anhydrase [Candidatus Hydrogenedentota bacterium]